MISPGRARNILVPQGEARYVVRGQAVSAVGSMLSRLEQSRLRSPTKAQSLADKQAQLTQEVRTSARNLISQFDLQLTRVHLAQSIDPLAVARKIESDLFASLSFLPPIPFARRTITAGATEGAIHGSVSAGDVVAAVRDFGITLEETVASGMGFVEGQPGLEKGRIKATGVYDCKSAHSNRAGRTNSRSGVLRPRGVG